METQRKTKKFYRELIAKQMLNTPISTIKEVIEKYAPVDKWWTEIYLAKHTEFHWNHKIEKIGVSRKKGNVYLDIYWQGDSTDGNDGADLSVVLNAVRYGRDYVIPAESEFIGDRTYYRHSDLRISKAEVEEAYKALIKYLTPLTKEEKEEIRINKVKKELDCKIISALKSTYSSISNYRSWDMFNPERSKMFDAYHRGEKAVKALVEKSLDKFNNLPTETFNKVVMEVYKKNAKTTAADPYGFNEDYDLTYTTAI